MKKVSGKLIIGINLLVIMIACVMFGGIKQEEIVFNEIPLYSWSGETGYYNYVDETFQNAKFWFRINTGYMTKGIWRMHVSYDTDSSSNSIGFLPDIDGYRVVVADTGLLDSAYDEYEQEIWVNRSIDNMNISIDRSNTGYMRIDSITLTRSNIRSFTYLLLRVIIKLLVLDILYFIIRYRETIKKNYEVFLGLFCIFMVSSLGVFTNSMIEGHDIWFHLARIEGIKDGLMSGAFPVKIQPNWLKGYGFAASVMYGDILLYIPAVLRVLGMPMQSAYKFYQMVIGLLTVLSSYFAFRRISKDKYIGLLGSALYSMSIYRIGSIWVRAGVGEYSAMVFFPLIVLGVWELLIADNAEENARYSWIWFALGYAGMIQTHVLSCEIITVFVAGVCVIRIRRVFKKETFIALCKSVGAVIITNLWFLVPFLDYFREDFKVFSERNVEYIQRVGISLYQLLSIPTAGRGTYQRYVPGVGGTVPFSLGVAPAAIIIMACVLLLGSEWQERWEKCKVTVCLGMTVLACFMSTSLFPWDTFSMMNSRLAELIVSIRRPTRFMTVAVVLVPLLACLVFGKLKNKLSSAKIKMLTMGLCIMCALEGLLFTDFTMRDNNNIVRYDGEQIVWELAISGQEYFYTGTDCMLALTDTEVSGNAYIEKYERNYNHFIIECEAEAGGYIECPVSYYRGYQAIDTDTGEKFEIGRGENNKLKIIFPEGYKGKLDVRFREPWYWRVSEVISLIAIFVFSGAAFWKYNKIQRFERN